MNGNSFIERVPPAGPGLRLGVKDVIDVAGMVTTGGCQVLAETAVPASADASCVALARRAGVQVVGKTNLVELALGAHGMNRRYGTPRNPLGATLIPGGSSSGSAVAVADGEVDVAYGTDTGGSIRIPAACCGVVGMKPSYGLVAGDGVMALAPSLDCVGPMAASVGLVAMAMGWLSAVRTPDLPVPAPRMLVHTAGADPIVADAVRRALVEAELRFEEREVTGWQAAWQAGGVILDAEAARTFAGLEPAWGRLDERVGERLRRGASYATEVVRDARQQCARWRRTLRAAVFDGQILVTPTLPVLPPSYASWRSVRMNWYTLPVNVAGLPAIVVPVARRGGLPASLQLVGAMGSEALLLAIAGRVESAVAGRRR